MMITTKRAAGWYAAAALSVFLLLLLSFPENRSENDDGYFYAYAISHYSYSELFLPRYLLFLPFLKALYDAGKMIFTDLDAYRMMCVVSSFFTAVSIPMFYHLLVKKFSLRHSVAMLACCLLLFTYGFWRYAVEAEVYAFSNLLLLLTILFLYPDQQSITPSYRHLLIAAFIAGFAILLYKPNAIVAGVAFGFPLLIRARWKSLLIYASVITVIVLVGYAAAYSFNPRNHASFLSFLADGSSRSYGSPLMSVFVIGSNIVSLNFIYGFPQVAAFIGQKFPANMIVEEVFAAQNKILFASISSFTLLVFLSLLVWLFFRNIRQVKWASVLANPFAMWVIFYSIMLLYLDPNSPEPWLMIVIPLVTLFSTSIVQLQVQKFGLKIPAMFAIVLLLHNFFGGFLFIKAKATDYTSYQAEWLVKNGTQKDLVLSLGSASMLRYVLYYAPVQLCTPEQQFAVCMEKIKETLAAGGRVYLLEDVVKPSKTVSFRNKKAYDAVVSFLQQNSSSIVPTNTATVQQASVYELLQLKE